MTDKRIMELWRESYLPNKGLNAQLQRCARLIAAETARECAELAQSTWHDEACDAAFDDGYAAAVEDIRDAIRHKYEVTMAELLTRKP